MAASSPRPVGPFIKWAGGKSQLLSQMRPFFPQRFRTYFEPFLGGGATFFSLSPKRAVLADSNPELVNTYVTVRDCPVDLMLALDRHTPRASEKSYFYRVRSTDPATLSPIERAARTIFLNKTCFNGLYRVNSRGEFNVPWGKYRNPTLYVRETLLADSAALRGMSLSSVDYRRACAKATLGDFAYLDPPYHPLSETSRFTSYTKEDFGEAEQTELAALYRELDAKGVQLMLSNSSTPLIRSLYEGFRVERLRAKRAINSKGALRGAIDELLILNYS